MSSTATILLSYFTLTLLVLMTDTHGINCKEHCEAWKCPCKCSMGQVLCSKHNITELSNFPSSSRFVLYNFNDNRLKKIRRCQFNSTEFEETETLQLAANQIETISGLAFLGLNNLGSLFLTRNKIEKLPRDALFGLNSLTRLFLNENKIRTITAGVFKPVSNTLELLYLQRNEIRSLHRHVFSGMVMLKTLDLSKNQLVGLEGTAGLSHLPNLETIFMAGNPWKCEKEDLCQFHPLFRMLSRRNGTTFLDNMRCKNDGKMIKQVYKRSRLSDDKCGIKPIDVQTAKTLSDQPDSQPGSGSTTLDSSLTLFVATQLLTIALFFSPLPC